MKKINEKLVRNRTHKIYGGSTYSDLHLLNDFIYYLADHKQEFLLVGITSTEFIKNGIRRVRAKGSLKMSPNFLFIKVESLILTKKISFSFSMPETLLQKI